MKQVLFDAAGLEDIVTRNTSDFGTSLVPSMRPEVLLAMLSELVESVAAKQVTVTANLFLRALHRCTGMGNLG